MDKKWTYMGIFLVSGSKINLLKETTNRIPEGWMRYCDHMTLVFNDGSKRAQEIADYYEPRIGESAELTVTHVGKTDKAMAAKVIWEDKCGNDIKHVTIAVSADGKPVMSNQITEWNEVEPFTLKGIIGRR